MRGCRTRFISYWSDNDLAIVPQRNAALRHPDLGARNIRLHGAGHLTLPMLGEVVHGISTALAHLDAARRHGDAGRHPAGPRRVSDRATCTARRADPGV